MQPTCVSIYSTPVARKLQHNNSISPKKQSHHEKRQHRLQPLGLPPSVRAQWMAEAQALYSSSSLYLEMQHSQSDESSAVSRCDLDSMQVINEPVVALSSEVLAANLQSHWEQNPHQDLPLCTITSPKLSLQIGISSLQPPYARSQRHKALLKRKLQPCIDRRVLIEPLLSTEMITKLQSHLEDKIQGNIWQNEIRSHLARPLSATTFCHRDEQLAHPLSALQLHEQFSDANPNPKKYPFSAQAHSHATQIAQTYKKHRFRVEILAQVRRLAVAIRFFRRVVIPSLVQGHRRRKKAARCIQRYLQKRVQWRREVFRPTLAITIERLIHQATVRAGAKLLIARILTKLYMARKQRQQAAARRAIHLQRWTAKTRVCLFVHQIWCVTWFRRKREANLHVMQNDQIALHAIEHQIQLKYQTLFKTTIGGKILKQELTAWRKSVTTNASQHQAAISNEPIGSTEEENDSLVRLRQFFRIFDLDGSGTLDLEEFQLLLSYLQKNGSDKKGNKNSHKPQNLSTIQVRNLFAELDEDESDAITYKELERWWIQQHASAGSSSAATSFLSEGLDRLMLHSHGIMFWLLGKKQQLERKFVKKLLLKKALDGTKKDFIQMRVKEEDGGITMMQKQEAFRCEQCGRRFGLERDRKEHIRGGCTAKAYVVDTFVLQSWIREEEIRLLDD